MMRQSLNGLNPLSYIGITASEPCPFVLATKAPIPTSTNFSLGTIWENTTTQDFYILASLDNGTAEWIQFASGSGSLGLDGLTGNTGGFVPADGANNINFLGANGITITGTPASHKLSIGTTSGNTLLMSLVGNNLLPVAPNGVGNINYLGTLGLTVTGNPGTNTLTISRASGLNAIETLTGNIGGAVAGDVNANINIVGGTNIAVAGNPATHTLTVSYSGPAAVSTSLTGNSGGAVSPNGAGNINVIGDGTTVTITGNPGTHRLTASIASGIATGFTTDDVHTAHAAAGILNVFGQNMLQTSSSGNTVRIGLTQGLNGQVPIAETGGNTIWAHLTSSNGSVTIINGPNSIDLKIPGSTARIAQFVEGVSLLKPNASHAGNDPYEMPYNVLGYASPGIQYLAAPYGSGPGGTPKLPKFTAQQTGMYKFTCWNVVLRSNPAGGAPAIDYPVLRKNGVSTYQLLSQPREWVNSIYSTLGNPGLDTIATTVLYLLAGDYIEYMRTLGVGSVPLYYGGGAPYNDPSIFQVRYIGPTV